MLCPSCKRSFFFLTALNWSAKARCVKCGHEAFAEKPSYEGYHRQLYSARNYQRTPRTDPQMQFILKEMRIAPGEVVMDLGCGVGDYTVQLAKRTENTAGYDLSVAAAVQKYPGVRFFEFDFEKPIPVPDASVDKIISVNVIEHLADWDFFLKECRRVLKPGGMIGLSTANREFILHDFHFDATHLHEWTAEEFEKITRPHFKTLSIRKDCAMFNYYPLNEVLRFLLKPDITWIGRKLFE